MANKLHIWLQDASIFKERKRFLPFISVSAGGCELYQTGNAGFPSRNVKKPVWNEYFTIPLLDYKKGFELTLKNASGVNGKTPMAKLHVPFKLFKRGTAVGFQDFVLQSMQGRGKREDIPFGSVFMRIQIQYPQSMVLPPNSVSRPSLSAFSTKAGPPMVIIDVPKTKNLPRNSKNVFIEIHSGKTCVKSKICMKTANGEAFWRNAKYWIPAQNSIIKVKVRSKGMSTYTVGKLEVNLSGFNHGEKDSNWYKLLNRKGKICGEIYITVQLQYHDSVIIPPESTKNLIANNGKNLFLSGSALDFLDVLAFSGEEAQRIEQEGVGNDIEHPQHNQDQQEKEMSRILEQSREEEQIRRAIEESRIDSQNYFQGYDEIEQRELENAIQASKQESIQNNDKIRQEDDSILRAAIQASLRDSNRISSPVYGRRPTSVQRFMEKQQPMSVNQSVGMYNSSNDYDDDNIRLSLRGSIELPGLIPNRRPSAPMYSNNSVISNVELLDPHKDEIFQNAEEEFSFAPNHFGSVDAEKKWRTTNFGSNENEKIDPLNLQKTYHEDSNQVLGIGIEENPYANFDNMISPKPPSTSPPVEQILDNISLQDKTSLQDIFDNPPPPPPRKNERVCAVPVPITSDFLV